MVQEIIKIINEKIEREIERINQEKEKKLLEIEKDYEVKLKNLKDFNLRKFKKEADSEIENFLQQKKMEANFVLEKEKNDIIKDVYKKAEDEILSQDPKAFKEMIEGLFNSIDHKKSGKIVAGPKTAVVLREILHSKDFEIKDDLPEEGFLLRGEEVDADFRISQILISLKERQEPEIVKSLFS